MTDMFSGLGQLLYNNTADIAITGVATVTGMDKSTVQIGAAVVTGLALTAGGAALTFKYSDTCRKKLSRNNSATTTPTVQDPQPNPSVDSEIPQLGGGETTSNPSAMPTDEANATENATSAATPDGNGNDSIGQRVKQGGFERKARSGIKIYK